MQKSGKMFEAGVVQKRYASQLEGRFEDHPEVTLGSDLTHLHIALAFPHLLHPVSHKNEICFQQLVFIS